MIRIIGIISILIFYLAYFIKLLGQKRHEELVTLQDNWRAGIPDTDKTQIVTTGIYRNSRNPAFLGFDLTYIGAILSFGNIVLVLIAVITIISMHLQILEEEQFLMITFGKEYIVYKNRVKRYFTFLNRGEITIEQLTVL